MQAKSQLYEGPLITSKLIAEFIGTFWLVLGGCGSAVLAAGFPDVGIGLLGVSLAFGLTVLTMAYAVGPISGGHFNPAVSFGLLAAGRFPANRLLPYIVSQVAGAAAGARSCSSLRAGNRALISPQGSHPTAMAPIRRGIIPSSRARHRSGDDLRFLVVILGAIDRRAPQGFAYSRLASR